jgi:hypothetical protein
VCTPLPPSRAAGARNEDGSDDADGRPAVGRKRPRVAAKLVTALEADPVIGEDAAPNEDGSDDADGRPAVGRKRPLVAAKLVTASEPDIASDEHAAPQHGDTTAEDEHGRPVAWWFKLTPGEKAVIRECVGWVARNA